MNVLLVGGGGREHAIAAKLNESPQLSRLYALPGSDGISEIAECAPIGVSDNDAILAYAKEHEIKMAVIGPEVPLMNGLADVLLAEGIMVLGPCASAAALEGSKAFAKDIMKKYGIPTGAYEVFTSCDEALAYAESCPVPIVVKADGLAAGKGVVIAETREAAKEAVISMMQDKVFGESGSKVVFEEFLEGEELSLLAFTDGVNVIPMVPSQDHKRIDDDDMGLNTGGMGAYAPAPVGSPGIIQKALEQVMKPLVKGMADEGITYKGVLYAGLMVKDGEVKVLEFNARFGDPETQAVLPLLDTDLIEIVKAVNEGTLDKMDIKWKKGYAVCVVISAENYPGTPVKGDAITFGDIADGTYVFHAGTKKSGEGFVTNGGRVLGVTALDADLKTAIEKAYAGVDKINFRGMHIRHDIGQKAFRHLKA